MLPVSDILIGVNWRRVAGGVVLAIALGVFLLLLLVIGVPLSYDWGFIRAGALEMLAGRSPFEAPMYYNPPWALLPLLPIALLNTAIGGLIITVLSAFALGMVAYRIGASPLSLALIVTSPPALILYRHANIDGLVAFGILLPPQIGLLFVLAKPQIGSAVALFWLIDSYRSGGPKYTLKIIAPLASILLLSLILYGFWPTQMLNVHARTQPVNISLWPWSLPAGLALLAQSIRARRLNLSLTASPLISPYAATYSWCVPLLGIANHPRLIALVVSIMWLIYPSFPHFSDLYPPITFLNP